MNKKAVIYWFSGTGNTEKVAKEYKKNFEENKINIKGISVVSIVLLVIYISVMLIF